MLRKAVKNEQTNALILKVNFGLLKGVLIWAKFQQNDIKYIGELVCKTGDELERMGFTQSEMKNIVLTLQTYHFKIGESPLNDDTFLRPIW
ncbi:MAG: hypothetical protein ABII18_11485 [bacterium]|nr:hypothetical protein [bacterium]MBU1918757.1 hypothetical protein [bacterium]